MVAKSLELGDGALPRPIGVSLGEEVAAEVFVDTSVAQEMPGDHKDRVADGNCGSLLADTSSQSPELGLEVGVLASCRRPRTLD